MTDGVLRTWLGRMGVDEFRAAHLRRGPVAMPSTATTACELFDWNVLIEVLADNPDALVVAAGELIPIEQPRTARELGLLLLRGIGLCIRHAERHHPNLARIAREIEATLVGAAAHVQLFVTPARTYGFSWHYDDEDVFIAQTAGRKEYFFRDNTVAKDVAAAAGVFSRFTTETSSLCNARLHAGDFLYLPARWWHMAECIQDSLSISVGVSGAS